MTISKDLLTKILSIFCIIASVVAIVFSVVACCLIKDDSERVYVESIALNEDGDLVVTYTDENTVTINLDGEDGQDGKSAYDLYLATVPEGETPMTVEEWLESLKGEDGKDGAAGTDGVGIAAIYLNEKNEITIVLTDHTVYNFPVSSVVEEQTPPVTEPSDDEGTEGDVA